MSYYAEILKYKQNEIDRLSEYEDRAEKAEAALRKILNYWELGDQVVYEKLQMIVDEYKCFPFAGFRRKKK